MPAWCKKLLFPGGKLVALLSILGAAGLYLTFGTWLGETPFAYFSYVLSAYALTIAVAWVVTKLPPAVGRILHSVSLIHRYLTDGYFKVRASLLTSLVINLAYAVFKMVYAIWYVSFWDGALALYNLLLCVVRFYLIRRVPKERSPADPAGGCGARRVPHEHGPRDRELEFRHYRATGFFLLALDGALGVIAVEIVQHGHSYSYPGTLIYVAALHAFYSLSLSITNAVKYKRFNSPVLSAAKAVNLTTALVSIFTLETAMLSAFGEDYQYQTLMTAATAGAVWVLVFCIAARMVFRAGKHLRRNRT